MNGRDKAWLERYHYHEAEAVDSCDLCAYANRIDENRDLRVESLTCEAACDDTGEAVPVDFGYICDLFLPEVMEEDEDD